MEKIEGQTQTQQYKDGDVKSSSQTVLAQLWKDDQMDSYLIDQAKKRNGSSEITEKQIITEYWRLWVQVDDKNYLKKLISHPALASSDYDNMYRMITNEKARQFLWSSVWTTLSLGFYSVFLSKMPVFYNFYKKPTKFRTIKYGKKGLSILFLLIAWTSGINVWYNKKIPFTLAKQNYYKQYHIEFNKQNY